MSDTQEKFGLVDRETRMRHGEDMLLGPILSEPRFLPPPAHLAPDALPNDIFEAGLFEWAFCLFTLDEAKLRSTLQGDDAAPLSPDDEQAIARLAQHDLLLFNVLVALEWTPDQAYLEDLQKAFQFASHILYDVTDGYMAFGQIVVGGKELMPYADIQIYASNRLFPRATVNGLSNLRKRQPIRIGRGLWNKQIGTAVSWEAGDDRKNQLGPQTLVHEWGHYALGLKDRYIELDPTGSFAVPKNDLVENSIMANLKKTELLSTRGSTDDSEWVALSLHPKYASLKIDQSHQAEERAEPLVPIPAFHVIGQATGGSQPLLLRWAEIKDFGLDPEHCWVYVVKGATVFEPTALIAQGTLDAEPGRFELLGAEEGDFVVLLGGKQNSDPYQPMVMWGKITSASPEQRWEWHDATRAEVPVFPIVSVAAAKNMQKRPAAYKLTADGFDSSWTPYVFPLGEDGGGRGQIDRELATLDGHVMLVASTGMIAVASYSVGGSPGGSSADPGHPNPLPAGSADGNAMLFFSDDRKNKLEYAKIYSAPTKDPLDLCYEKFAIVTATNPISSVPAALGGWRPCSYVFSVTSNMSFAWLRPGQAIASGNTTVETEDIHPTLVLYFDGDPDKYDFAIGRYDADQAGWRLIDNGDKLYTNLKSRHLIAIALDNTGEDKTAPGLYDAQRPKAEAYCLFKRPAAG